MWLACRFPLPSLLVGVWLGTRTEAGGTATLTESFFGRSPRLHRQQVITRDVGLTTIRSSRSRTRDSLLQ